MIRSEGGKIGTSEAIRGALCKKLNHDFSAHQQTFTEWSVCHIYFNIKTYLYLEFYHLGVICFYKPIHKIYSNPSEYYPGVWIKPAKHVDIIEKTNTWCTNQKCWKPTPQVKYTDINQKSKLGMGLLNINTTYKLIVNSFKYHPKLSEAEYTRSSRFRSTSV